MRLTDQELAAIVANQCELDENLLGQLDEPTFRQIATEMGW